MSWKSLASTNFRVRKYLSETRKRHSELKEKSKNSKAKCHYRRYVKNLVNVCNMMLLGWSVAHKLS